jgi:adenine-specific DNA-methyltransferase
MHLEDRKALGAYYTDTAVAASMCNWAIRRATDAVCDPSFGGGVFLRAARARLDSLSGPGQISGVEIDHRAHSRLVRAAQDLGLGFDSAHLHRRDFFDVEPGDLGPFDAIVGNPPYIRHHRYQGPSRVKALARATANGINLHETTNIWVPFVAHACSFLKLRGRIAMVVPAECLSVRYTLPFFQFLVSRFESVKVITFLERRLFLDLDQDAAILLAEGYGLGNGRLELKVLSPGDNFDGRDHAVEQTGRSEVIDMNQIDPRRTKLTEYLIEPRVRDLLGELSTRTNIRRLGEFVKIGIGYVTGDSTFFHFSEPEARALHVPPNWLLPAVQRARLLSGISFHKRDWQVLSRTGQPAYLFKRRSKRGPIPSSVRALLESNEAAPVRQRFKCASRDIWWDVDVGRKPHGFLCYGVKQGVRLVANFASVYASNSLHVLRCKPGTKAILPTVAASWLSTLSQLSIEIHGQRRAGGMLKIEPTDAERTLLFVPCLPDLFLPFASTVDQLLRSESPDRVRAYVDEILLQGPLRLSKTELGLLRQALSNLRLRTSRQPGKPSRFT